MNEVLKHLGVFLGIISFFSGIIVLTVNIAFCRAKENPFYQLLRRYHLAFFAYVVTIFAYYYAKQFFVGEREFALINILGNVTLALLCISHAKIVEYLNKRGNSIHYRLLVAVNIFYIIGWIFITLFSADKEGYVFTKAGTAAVWGVEGLVLAALVFFVAGEYKHRQNERWSHFFLRVFVVEYLWEMMYDLAMAVPFFRFTQAVRPFNLIFIVYIMVNITLLCGIYWKELGVKVENTEKTEDETAEERAAEEKTEEKTGEKIIPDGKAESVSEKEETDLIAEMAEKCGLTAREVEVLQLLLERRSNQEIAELLYISNNTVKHHVSNVFRKTEVTRRSELQQLFQNHRK